MKETLKSKKGITLIALIITIIVLIILAGISIAVLTGEDGLITKAKQGAQNYQNAAIEEQQALNSIYAQTGAQLAVGSTNNGGTSVNQGGTTGGGLTPQEHAWLESISCKPAIGDINPEKQKIEPYATFTGTYLSGNNSISTCLNVKGYAKMSISGTASEYNTIYSFRDEGNNEIGSSVSFRGNNWIEYVTIPSNAVTCKITVDTYLQWPGYYSLLTKDSPYNPDNQ